MTRPSPTVAFDLRYGIGQPVQPPPLLEGDLVENGVIVRKVFAILIQITLYSTVFALVAQAFLVFLVPPEVLAEAAGTVTAAAMWWDLAIFAFLAALPLIHHALVAPGDSIIAHFRLQGDYRAAMYGIFGAGVGVAGVVVLLVTTWLAPLPEPSTVGSQIEQAFVEVLNENPALYLAIPLGAALTEEIIFRGFFQPRLGLAATSVLFGVAHSGWLDPFHIAVATAAGFGLGYLYIRSGTLWAPIVAHFCYNGVLMLLVYRAS